MRGVEDAPAVGRPGQRVEHDCLTDTPRGPAIDADHPNRLPASTPGHECDLTAVRRKRWAIVDCVTARELFGLTHIRPRQPQRACSAARRAERQSAS